jgi:hypothetical protein
MKRLLQSRQTESENLGPSCHLHNLHHQQVLPIRCTRGQKAEPGKTPSKMRLARLATRISVPYFLNFF